MSTPSPAAKKTRPRTVPQDGPGAGAARLAAGLRWLDVLNLAAFLALTLLLGAFPLKDTDFWWHLRTGDLIRSTGVVPQADWYTFGAAGQPWIDLHWLFQVAVSLVYERGGVRALTLAKCGVTCLAVFLLVTSGRREWPVWVALTAWLPALLVLGGRMYVRPETLTLLYLSCFLAVLVRIDRAPWLAFALPVVQVAWVNTQGLFVLGPILLGAAVVDAALRPGAFASGRRPWWRMVGGSAALTGLACLINPYGLRGALYPVQLARTMGNPVFSHTIAELTPIPLFIRRDGLISLPLRLHIVTMALGALSFLVPMTWVVLTRLRPSPAAPGAGPPARMEAKAKPAKRTPRPEAPRVEPAGWRLSPFRLILFAAFSGLSWQATRNSHQFAAVVGSITAWNLGEWAAAVFRRADARMGAVAPRPSAGVAPRLAALAVIAGVFVWVASGQFYEATREGRTIGLGEQPLWFPHEAVRFCGGPGMPPRFLSYHIGHASLYDYYFGPDRKVYVDARLEVIGPDLYERYNDLHDRIAENDRSWAGELDEIGRPVVLVDLENNATVGATLLNSPGWRCVWLDPIAAVFVHASYVKVVEAHGVDFAGRHFRPEPAYEPRGVPALRASAKGLRNLASAAGPTAPDRVRSLALLGMDHARRALKDDRGGAEPWKLLAQFELLREPPGREPVPRFRKPFDPVFDLSTARATYALRRALEAEPNDFMALYLLSGTFRNRLMSEEAVAVLDRLLSVTPINGLQAQSLLDARGIVDSLRTGLGAEPPRAWDNLAQLSEITSRQLNTGRVRSAAETLTRDAPDSARSWEEIDRIATLRLHLGEPAEARRLWRSAATPPRPGVRDARVAVTHLVEGDFGAARASYQAATAADPELFEAWYGLAVLEQDAGRAAEALGAARKAVELAPGDVARSAAQGVVSVVTPYATPPVANRTVR